MLCWWCCHEIESESLHLPYKYNNKKFNTMGHFCSWSCMKAFNIESFPQHKSGSYGMNIMLMKKNIDGKIEPIITAPSKYCLIAFGGTISIEEFRANGNKIKTTLPTQNLIFNDIDITYKEPNATTTTSIQNEHQYKLTEINQSTQKNQALKLKREKPLKRNKNNLETALGLKK